MSPFLRLSRPALSSIADALETERLAFPASSVSLRSYVPETLLPEVVAEVNQLHQQGMTGNQIAYMLRLLAQERTASQARQDLIDLVWTGPEVLGTESRDTGVVVRELFSSAQHSVLISSFAIDQGAKGHELFRPLAERMDTNPNLQVRMFLNVKRKYQDPTPASVLLRQFAETFRRHVWPGKRLPEVFHDPRAVEMTADSNVCLQAKCVVVDEERLLITSANFTEAAHERNIEAGILMTDRIVARAIRSQFEMLSARGALKRVPGL
ncbi:DISARM system phospholipase D-like protein DrmC [Pseudanabaena sp. FACHB-2040]|uniref:DISARM system phospholipase D-like protein DrmC n=1 Tax=Pseudanabaena sp. FACHB-2040 TaxID=2692859 RepID=UPI001682E370|nr:DISARM system phospholipase D-like protein DrmC [Pseudanabaena sp. FACHB-2040]MBD2261195.1 phospholipase [Pseudanabaena sp. FACHB-2040]